MNAGERWSRRAVIGLALFPIVSLGKCFTHVPESAARHPALVHLVVVTTPVWPADADLSLPGFAELVRRGARLEQSYAPSASRAGATASLWTGRYPADHGVVTNRLALPPDTWTLARAARSAGARTAAYLAEPFVSVTGIAGFEDVHESPDLDARELAERARVFAAGDVEETSLLWLHLADPGPRGAALDELLTALLAEPDDPLRASARMLLVTAFASEPGDAPGLRLDDARARVPLHAVLPSGMSVGVRGRGAASLTGVPGLVCELLRFRPPTDGEPPLQADGRALWADLDGAGVYDLVLLEGEHGPILRLGRTRVAPRADKSLLAEYARDPARDDAFDPAPRDLAVQMKAQYRVLLERLGPPARPPLSAALDARWSGDSGW